MKCNLGLGCFDDDFNLLRRTVKYLSGGTIPPWLLVHNETRFFDYDALLLFQDGVCAICRKKDSFGQRLAVDHDHSTDLIRGLLCRKCNTGIGQFDDDPSRLIVAADYLERFGAKPKMVWKHRLFGRILDRLI